MFSELQDALARRRVSVDASSASAADAASPLRRSASAGTLEAAEVAALRRQRSSRQAELVAAEQAGATRREKQAKQAAQEDVSLQIIAQRKCVCR